MNTLKCGEINLSQEKNQDLSRTKQQMLEDREVKRLANELASLSEFEEQNIWRMKEIAHVLVDHFMHPETSDSSTTEHKNRICKEWLEMNSCRECLFDTLCNLKYQQSNAPLE